MANRKFLVTYKIGDPDAGQEVEIRTAETMAASARQAVSNVFCRLGGTNSFWLVKVVEA